MKKFICVIIALCLSAALFACGKEEPEPTPLSGVANPVTESTQEELSALIGTDFRAPDGASGTSFFSIAGDPQLAEARFEFDGNDIVLRSAKTAELQDISGMYCDWTTVTKANGIGLDYTIFFNKGAEGILQWYGNGCSWVIIMDKNASPSALSAVFDALNTDPTPIKLFDPDGAK